MVINIADVRDVGAKIRDHLSNLAARLGGIDRAKRKSRFRGYSAVALEIDTRDKVVVIGSLLSARIGHGEEGHFVAPGAHQFHGFK